ncbi:hypothetical protein INP83_05030 [Mucilaginibacter sp. 21P]|uniref:hypothetical protein n=1 Tax=Mucilaginibacter sp. 21P TaxID=2778902 RepID=UPI001C584294|nr:hypothetical protein [Mucilaginibacter sp. 21P]QXV66450.1 hypothetical protein INP83_05030 [Mucilaginibacter sp. 21P]
MKQKIITKVKEALFRLHSDVRPYYEILKLIEDIRPDTETLQHSKAKRKYERGTITLDELSPVTRRVRNSGENLQTRVLSAITELGRFVRLGEILEKIKIEDVNFSASISPALTQLKQLGTIKNYKPTGNRKLTYWGLTEWEWKDESKA